MTISKAIELVHALGLAVELPDLDFADLAVDLVVDEERILVEYLVNAEAFLVVGTVAEAVDGADPVLLGRVADLANHLAMSGGEALTLDRRRSRILLSVRLDIDGLTHQRLGSWVGHLADGLPTMRAALTAATPAEAPPPDIGTSIRA